MAKAEIVNLEMHRGDQGAGSTFSFVHGRLANEIVQARFYVRDRVPQPNKQNVIFFAIRWTERPGDWTVEDETATVVVRAADTDAMPSGNWYYDVEFILSNGDIITPQRGRFELIGDIVTDMAGTPAPAPFYYVTASQKCALDHAPHASCENPFVTVNDFYANMSSLHSVTQFRASWQSQTGYVGGMPGGVLITDVYIIRLTPWDDLTNFQLGRDGQPGWLVGNHQHNLLEPLPAGETSAVRRVTVNKYVDQPISLLATWDQGDATQGEALILVDWRTLHFKSLYAEITYDGPTGQTIIGTVPGHSIITGVWVVRTVPFSWSPLPPIPPKTVYTDGAHFRVGKSGALSWLVANGDHNLAEAIPAGEAGGVTHVIHNSRYVADPTPIIMDYRKDGHNNVNGDSYVGDGFVVVTYEPLMAGSFGL